MQCCAVLRILNRFFIHLREFFKEFSMNFVDFFLYSGIVVDFVPWTMREINHNGTMFSDCNIAVMNQNNTAFKFSQSCL
jgi:hypothetical protein